MKVHLMLTCLADAFAGRVGIATTEILERLGCQVLFSPAQTCCGQPLFNTGAWDKARELNESYWRAIVGDADPAIPMVSPSASCAAMMRHGAKMIGGPACPARVYELAEFLVQRLKMTDWPGPGFPDGRRIVFHPACHTRMLGTTGLQEQILDLIPGLDWTQARDAEQCCGFGGAFSIELPAISAEIGHEKLRTVGETGRPEFVTGDLGCLLHLQGLAAKSGSDMRFTHFVELLREALG